MVAYGKILPQEILDLPQSLCINIHGSLLPAYRGASPIQSALLDGVSITGVTIMEMSLGMDEGDILRTLEIPIDPEETAHSLFEKFGVLCGPLCRSTLQDHRAGKIIPIAQGAGATYTKKFTKEDGYIDISQHTAAEIYRRYQAFFPWPGIWTTIKDRRCKILRLAHPDTPPSTGVCVPTR